MDDLVEQFALYQSSDISSCQNLRMDETWSTIGDIKDENGIQILKALSKVMLGILSIPHSCAHCERVFSTVRKNRTNQRASTGDDTLEALLVLKSQPGCPTDRRRWANIVLALGERLMFAGFMLGFEQLCIVIMIMIVVMNF